MVGAAVGVLTLVLGAGPVGAGSERGGGKETIKIMQITILSGPTKYTNVEQSAKAAVKEINASGDLGDRKLKLIVCDTEGTLTGSEDCGQRAVDEGVVAGVGCIETFDSGFLGVFEQNDLACIANVTGADPAAFTSSASFPVDPGAFGQLPGVVAQLAEGGAKKIAMAFPPSGAQAAALAQEGLERYPGVEIVNVEIPEGAPDMSSYAAAATADGADAVYGLLFVSDLVNFINEVRIVDADIPIGFTTTDPGLVLEGLESTDNLMTTLPYLTPSASQAKAYRKAMKAAGSKPVAGVAMNGYVAVHVFAEIANDLEEVTPAAVTAAVSAIGPPGIATGLRPPAQFTEPVVPGLRVFSRCIAPAEVKKGKLVLVDREAPFIDPVSGEECAIS
jgi:ABC-type branched-subunit amino acid transport system substrate-binding protein